MNLSRGQLSPAVILVAFIELTIAPSPAAIWYTFDFVNCTLSTKESLFALSCNRFEVVAFLNFHLSRFRCCR